MSTTDDGPVAPKTVKRGATTYACVHYELLKGSPAQPLYFPVEVLDAAGGDPSHIVGNTTLLQFGYRAKYDPNKRAWFFVNLAEKSIKTWKLPEVKPSQLSGPVAALSASPPPPAAAERKRSEPPAETIAVQHRPEGQGVSLPQVLKKQQEESAEADEAAERRKRDQRRLAMLELEARESEVRNADIMWVEVRERSVFSVAAHSGALEIQRATKERSYELERQLLHKIDEEEQRARCEAMVPAESKARQSLVRRSIESFQSACLSAVEGDESRSRRHIIDDASSDRLGVGTKFNDEMTRMAQLRQNAEKERLVHVQKEIRAAAVQRLEECVQLEGALREGIIRDQAAERIRIATSEGRRSIRSMMDGEMKDRERAIIRTAESCSAKIVNHVAEWCFFEILQNFADFTLESNRLYQNFIQVITGRKGAVGSAYPSSETRSFAAAPPRSEPSWSLRSNTSASNAAPHVENSVQRRVEKWKSQMQELHALRDRLTASIPRAEVFTSSIFDQSKLSFIPYTNRGLARYQTRCGAALLNPMTTPQVPPEIEFTPSAKEEAAWPPVESSTAPHTADVSAVAALDFDEHQHVPPLDPEPQPVPPTAESKKMQILHESLQQRLELAADQDLLWDDCQTRGAALSQDGLVAVAAPRQGPPHQLELLSTESFVIGTLGVARGQFIWEVQLQRRCALERQQSSAPSVMVGMASRYYNGCHSTCPAYWFKEDGSVSCAADGSDASEFGMPFLSFIAPGVDAVANVTVHLDMNRWELSFYVNGQFQGVAFRFTPLDDPEPLFPVVVFSGPGDTATLQPPSAPGLPLRA